MIESVFAPDWRHGVQYQGLLAEAELLVQKQNDIAVLLRFLDNSLQPFFDLATVLGARNQSGHAHFDDAFPFEDVEGVGTHDVLC